MESAENNLFYMGAFHQTININIADLANNNDIDGLILDRLKDEVGNKCIRHGYIKKSSINIIKRTIGKINSARLDGSINYDISYSAEVCSPQQGQIINCKVKNMNKMGILAEERPLIIVISRTPETAEKIANTNIGDEIKISIMGSRFDLYDDNITVVGKLA